MNPSYTPNATFGTDNGARTLLMGGASGFPDAGLWDFRGTDVKAQRLILTDTTFATLSGLVSPPNGSLIYCSDCKIVSACTSGGTGALAKRLNGAWVCN